MARYKLYSYAGTHWLGVIKFDQSTRLTPSLFPVITSIVAALLIASYMVSG